MPRRKNLTLATARLWSPCLPSQLGEQVGEKHKAEEAGSEAQSPCPLDPWLSVRERSRWLRATLR